MLFDEHGESLSQWWDYIVPLDLKKESEYLVVQTDNKSGLINLNGEILVPPEYQFLGDYSEGLLRFAKDDKMGYMDLSGEIQIPAQFSFEDHRAPLPFRGGTALLPLGGAINKKGEVIVPAGYEAYNLLENGYVIVYTAEVDDEARQSYLEEPTESFYNAMYSDIRWGMYDNTGKLIFSPKYKTSAKMTDLHFNLFPSTINDELIVKTDSGVGMIDMQGNYIIQPIYEELQSFSDGIAVAKQKNGLYTHITKNGVSLYQKCWHMVYPFSEGYGAVENEDGTLCFSDQNGNLVLS